MMVKANRARDLSIVGATRKFRREIKDACENGKFSTTILCDTENELLMYEILADSNGYAYKRIWDKNWGKIEVMW
jgi:hypothetical protein